MLKSQIMKGDDFKEWGQQLKEEIFAKAKVTTVLQALYQLHIHYLFIIHPSHFIFEEKKEPKRASSPFSWNFCLQVSKKDSQREKEDHKETPITHFFILPLITIHSSTSYVIFSTPLLQFTKGLCFLQDDPVGITMTQKSYRRCPNCGTR